MGVMPKPTQSDPWQLMQAFAHAGYRGGYGGYGRNGNRYIGGMGRGSNQVPPQASPNNDLAYQDALQDYNQDREIYPEVDNGPPPMMTQKIGSGYDGTTPIGAKGAIPIMIRNSAIARGIDPNVALKVAASEGGLDGKFRVGDDGSSGGPFQLHVGGVGRGGNNVGGLGDEFVKKYGAITAANVQQQVDFALDKAKAGGWGPWHGYKGGQWDGIGRGGTSPVPIAPKQTASNDPDMTPDGRVSPEAIQRGKDQLQDQIQDMELMKRADNGLEGQPQQVAQVENVDVDQSDPSSRLSWLV